MKNLHVFSTDKPSSYVINYIEQNMQWQNIYITNSEEIKEGDWYYLPKENKVAKCPKTIKLSGVTPEWTQKIILTTDQDLIKDGIQAIPDEFIEWFVHNPSCEYVEVELIDIYFLFNKELTKSDEIIKTYKIIIPKEPKKTDEKGRVMTYWGGLEEPKETIEEAAERIYVDNLFDYEKYRDGFIEGAKWQQEQDRWKTVSEETPPSNIELLVQSPEGIVHLSRWRESYNIFTCQTKSESSFDWKWKMI